MIRHWFWDLETGPLFPTELAVEMAGKRFEGPKYPGEFDPSSVKTGNYGEAKKAEKIEAARVAHIKKLEGYITDYAIAKAAHDDKILSTAALSAITGQVLLGGFSCYETGDCELFFRPLIRIPKSGVIYDRELDGPTLESIAMFLSRIGKRDRLIGWNTHGYDCPFLIRRSLRLSRWVSDTFKAAFFQERFVGDKWFNHNVKNIDLMKEWRLGEKSGAEGESRLDSVARHFGHTGKSFDGASFWKIWLVDQKAGISGNMNDLDMLRLVSERFGILGRSK